MLPSGDHISFSQVSFGISSSHLPAIRKAERSSEKVVGNTLDENPNVLRAQTERVRYPHLRGWEIFYYSMSFLWPWRESSFDHLCEVYSLLALILGPLRFQRNKIVQRSSKAIFKFFLFLFAFLSGWKSDQWSDICLLSNLAILGNFLRDWICSGFDFETQHAILFSLFCRTLNIGLETFERS